VKMTLALRKWWHVDVVGAAVLAALAMIVYVCGYYPLMQSHEEYLAKRRELAAQREQSARLESTLLSLQKRLNAARDMLQVGNLGLKPASSLNSQLTQISALAARSGLAIADVRTDTVVLEKQCEVFPIVLAGNGTCRACTLVLSELKTQFPDTTVQSLDLVAGAGDATGMGKFSFRLRWHAAAKPTLAVKPDTPQRG